MKHPVWMVVIGLAGCFGGDEDLSEVSQAPSSASLLKTDKCSKKPKKKCAATTATVDVDGGTITTDDGLTLDVPFGALDQPTELTITATTLDPDPAIGGAGVVYSFEPEGTVFVRPVDVTLPLPAGMNPATVYWTKLGSLEFEPIGGVISGNTITASTYHFSLAQVGAPVHDPSIRGQAFQTFITQNSIDRRSRPSFVDFSEIEAIVGDGAGGYTHLPASPVLSAVEPFDPLPGRFQIEDLPTGGDYILRWGQEYLVTSTATPDIGFSTGGHFPEELTESTTESLNIRITNLEPWQDGSQDDPLDEIPDHVVDQIEWFAVEPDDWLFEAQAYARIEGETEHTPIAKGATTAYLSMPLAHAGGGNGLSGHLIKSNHKLYVAQLANKTTSTGVRYEAMSRIGIVPAFDMVEGQDATVDVSLDTNLSDNHTLSVNWLGTHWNAKTAEYGHPAADPFCFFCGGFTAVLGQPGRTEDGFYGANADLLILHDLVGTDLDAQGMMYGSPSELGGDWGTLFLARWTSRVGYQLPGTTGQGPGAFAPNVIDWTTTPELVDGTDVGAPLTAPRNIFVDGIPFHIGSTTNLSTTPTVTWTAPEIVPTIAPETGTGPDVPAPVLYSVTARRMFVDGDNRTRGQRIAAFYTYDTSLTFPPGVLTAGDTYIFIVVANAGTTRGGADQLRDEPFRAVLHTAFATTSSAVFGDAHGTPPPPPAAIPFVEGQSYPMGIVAQAEGVFWAERGDSPWEDPQPFTNTGRIWRSELDGSGAIALVVGQSNPTSVAVDGNNLYWNTAESDGNNTIRVIDYTTCSAPCTGIEIVSGEGVGSMLVVGGDLYWLGNGVRVLRSGATTPDTLAPDGGVNLASDGVNIYWTDYGGDPGNGRVLSVPVGGGLAVPIATGGSQTWDVQTDGSFVYFSNQAWQQPFPATIQRVPVGGGTVETIATGLEVLTSEIMKVFGIDTTHAYYVDLYAQLMRAPLDGSSAPENLGPLDLGGWCPQGKIALHDGFAYWTDTCGQMVVRADVP